MKFQSSFMSIQVMKLVDQTQAMYKSHPIVMQAVTVMSIGISLLTLRVIVQKFATRVRNYPPHLHGLPIIGSLLTMQIYKHNFDLSLLPSYGDIVGFNIGNMRFYRLNNVDLISKVFNKALNRPESWVRANTKYNLVPNVLAVNQDRDWSQRRKRVMTALTTILNKSTVEANLSMILQNITYKELDDQLNKCKINKNGSNDDDDDDDEISSGYQWYPRKLIQNAVFNSIYIAMFGKSLMINDSKFVLYAKCIEMVADNTAFAVMVDILGDFIGKLLLSKQEQLFCTHFTKLHELIRDDCNQFLIRTDDENNHNNNNNNTHEDTICDLLISKEVQRDKLKFDRIVADLAVLSIAGMDTTSHTTEVACLLLAKYPRVQDIVYQELSGVTQESENGEFRLSDVKSCPYFRAFVNEALRLAIAVPDGVTRSNDKDIRCLKYKSLENGKIEILCDFVDSNLWQSNKMKNININSVEYNYIIPKYSYIEPNLPYLHRKNTNAWNLGAGINTSDNKEGAAMLNLDYWLEKDANKVKFVVNHNSLPFSLGKRECLGQSLAKKELFAFLANLLLRYKLIAPNNDASSMNIQYTFNQTVTVVDPPMHVVIKQR